MGRPRPELGLAGAGIEKPSSAGLISALLLTACSGSDSAPSPSVSASQDPLAAALKAEMDSYIADANIRAILVDVDGQRRFEHYYSASADDYRDSFSVTKSVIRRWPRSPSTRAT